MAADSQDSDHYPVKISKKSIVPGTVYYDPDGHVAVVAKVTEDGRVRVIDAHPDRTISKPWFGAKLYRVLRPTGAVLKSGVRSVIHQVEPLLELAITTFLTTLPKISFRKVILSGEKADLGYHEYIRRRLLAKIAVATS